jgi:hypothetical protein
VSRLPQPLERALEAWNRGSFDASRDAIDEAFHREREPELRALYRGLQLAASAFARLRAGERDEARRLLGEAVARLRPLQPARGGIELGDLTSALDRCRRDLEAIGDASGFDWGSVPRIERASLA